ncbi:MAG: exodeoxyribonuclease large subunit [Acetobacteraceae bacterium]|jgi:exodeoxyribonuclease VII large subunit|nr:exodeoxyribonuclease large subunit [Acetobacteraceae bacterium]
MDDPRPAVVSNMPEYTVSEISGAVKRTLEITFGRVRVRGELTEVKHYPSGHIYLSLKDENSKISGIVWKTTVPRLGMAPENGTEVIATGRISAYGERSSYQLIIERMEYAGVGALLARIEMIRQRLTAEGIFDAERKRALPVLPKVIGVVTSERGAVIQDIKITISRRFPATILVWPVPVQGEGAAERIAAAIAGFDAMPAGGDPPRPDVLIIARGGGSLEDLMAFNEEIVVRAAAACRIPLISAVGHETDTTLIDFVSDRRAPTPTAAAEMAIPARSDLVADLAQKGARLIGALNRLAQESRLRLSRVERGIPDLPALLGSARQRLDDRAERAILALPSLLARRRVILTSVERRLPDPRKFTAAAREIVRDRGLRLRLSAPGLVASNRSRLDMTSQRLGNAVHRALATIRGTADRVAGRLSDAPLRASLREARAHLAGLGPRLEVASPLAQLQRGYVLVTTPAGQPVTSAASVKPGGRLRLHFGDGQIDAVAQGGTARSRPATAQELLDL